MSANKEKYQYFSFGGGGGGGGGGGIKGDLQMANRHLLSAVPLVEISVV